jgi:HSP20 family protein
MKLDLSHWNPFKFFRKTPEEKRAEPAATTALAPAAGHERPAGLEAWRLPLADPWRMMHDLLHDPFAGVGQLERWFGDFSPRLFQPHIDMVDDGDALRLTAELPGMERQDVEILVEEDALVLRGEKKLESRSEEQGCYRLERAFGSFQRVIPLPDGVDVAQAEARFDKGVLTIRLPKMATAKASGRRLDIT